MPARLLHLLRALDVAVFAAGLVALWLWGWPTSWWGWGLLGSALLPLPAALAYLWWHKRRQARLVRLTMAYRRQKFGGFVVLPRRDPATGQRKVLPLHRQASGPTPWDRT